MSKSIFKKEFREKFGGDGVWLEADRKLVEDFWLEKIQEVFDMCIGEEEIHLNSQGGDFKTFAKGYDKKVQELKQLKEKFNK